MITISNFSPTEDNTEFEGVINNISVKIAEDHLSNEVVQYAEKIVNAFLQRKDEVYQYLFKELSDVYRQYNLQEMIEKLNEPEITIWQDSGNIVWLNHELDHEHIITLDFENDLELMSVSLDG